MNIFSQLGQDIWALNKYPKRIKGYYVDVGCSDGIVLNNTYLLELNGWYGIGVDPLPINFDSRPSTKLYTNVLSSSIEIIDYLITDDSMYSGILKNINHHKNLITNKNTIIKQLTTQTLYNILLDAKSPRFIHYLSLDTEGSEYDILKNFPFNKYVFGCISVEHNYIEPERTLIRNLLYKHGYKLDSELEWDDLFIYSKIKI